MFRPGVLTRQLFPLLRYEVRDLLRVGSGIETWRNLAPEDGPKVRAELDLKTDRWGRPFSPHLSLGPIRLIQRAGGTALGDAHEEPVPAGAVAAELIAGTPPHVLDDGGETETRPR